jgi:UDP-2-acetamido-3-amino-2,3-dideoxy-glucuronate N-acetyltransferase
MTNIHKLSDVQTENIGENTYVWQFTVILKGAIIGSNCNINANCFIENDVIINNNVTVKSGVQLWDGITLEDNVFIGPNVSFTNDLVPRSKVYPTSFEKTIIRHHASIGANSTIIAGNEIGEYSLIGAGSVVTKTVPPYTVWYGNPATHKGYITKDGILLNLELVDTKNCQSYILVNNEPIEK